MIKCRTTSVYLSDLVVLNKKIMFEILFNNKIKVSNDFKNIEKRYFPLPSSSNLFTENIYNRDMSHSREDTVLLT